MPHQVRRKDIRNIAIIAHVDHGKTTLVDAMLKQTGVFRQNEEVADRVMDSNDLERERGITIFSKNASIDYKGIKINIVDTPGHSDFGSEVERILQMVDGVLLLVDAFEGPMPQTKFVLRKALDLHLKPILVINKVDRPDARAHEVVNETFDLFCDLNATDEQLDFAVVYCSAKDGVAWYEVDEQSDGLKPLLETIIRRVLPPVANPDKPLQMLITMLDYDNYIGSLGLGRIVHGEMAVGDQIYLMRRDGTKHAGKVSGLFTYKGMKRLPVQHAKAGDIVCVAGMDDFNVGETIASFESPEALPFVNIDEPTISVMIGPNTSPFVGKDGGKFLTSRHIRERLVREARVNVGLRVEEPDTEDMLKVSGRGELHLSILIETMRREGYELEVSKPKVIFKEIDGKLLEPLEYLVIDVDREFHGYVIEEMGKRKADMKNFEETDSGSVRMEYIIPSRSLIGFRSDFLTMTRGTGTLYSNFFEYEYFKGEIPTRDQGVLICHAPGKAVRYALNGLQDRGHLFIPPNTDVYEGMIIGENNKGVDLTVNAVKEKKLTNMRSSGADDAIRLTPHKELTLEQALEFIEDDELVEVTPKAVRIRKKLLDDNSRKKANKAGS
ncbi:MAG TPA: translational GTPase TypA [Candidatus Aquicultor sp.]|jgi:GTP-binding protein